MKRQILVFGLIVLLFVSVPGSVLAQDAFDPYAPYRGDTIVVSWPSLYHFQQAATLIPMFEEESGIKRRS